MRTKTDLPDPTEKYPGAEQYQERLLPLLQGGKREDNIPEYNLVLSWAVARYESIQAFRMATDNRAREMLSKFDLHETGMFDALAMFTGQENVEGKTMSGLIKMHPMHAFMVGFAGIDNVIAARTVGNTPDLWEFPGVSKLWAFWHMDGDEWRQLKRLTKKGGKMAYRGSPQLRSLAWNMGKSFMQHGHEGSRKDPRFGLVCQERILYEASKDGCGQLLKTKGGEVYSDCTQGHCSKLHQERKAKVYAVKEYLKVLWEEWRRVMPEPLAQ